MCKWLQKQINAEPSWPAAVGQTTSPTHLKVAESFTTLEKNSAVFIFQNYPRQVLHVQKEGRKWLHRLERETEKKKMTLNDIKERLLMFRHLRGKQKKKIIKQSQYQAARLSAHAYPHVFFFFFVVNLLYFRRELLYDSDRLRLATELHLWVTRAGLKPRHISYILNIDEAKKKKEKKNTAAAVVLGSVHGGKCGHDATTPPAHSTQRRVSLPVLLSRQRLTSRQTGVAWPLELRET